MTPDTLRSIPSVETLLNEPRITDAIGRSGREVAVYAVRQSVDRARRRIVDGKAASDPAAIVDEAISTIHAITQPSLRPVINATGVIVHTNLGRAPLGPAVLADIDPIVNGYCNLEFDLATGRRGHRIDHVREILRFVTGAGDVVVVNNNAAAVILTLHTLARHKEVPISRGELVEIGGAFRIPEIMAASGTRMKEVGATNRTRLSDYEKALGPETALLFKAHCSNYAIKGFTEEVSVKALADLAHARGLPMVYDIGSGLLRPTGNPELDKEPNVRSALADGADLVMFSCDKLLGGPQAGIIAGRADLIAQLSKAPFMRALRVGKLTLAALWSVCRRVCDGTGQPANPVSGMFAASSGELRSRAMRLASMLQAKGIPCSVESSNGQAGGGSLPDTVFASFAVALTPPGTSVKHHTAFAENIYTGLMRGPTPILAVLREGRVILDVLTLREEELGAVVEAMEKTIANIEYRLANIQHRS